MHGCLWPPFSASSNAELREWKNMTLVFCNSSSTRCARCVQSFSSGSCIKKDQQESNSSWNCQRLRWVANCIVVSCYISMVGWNHHLTWDMCSINYLAGFCSTTKDLPREGILSGEILCLDDHWILLSTWLHICFLQNPLYGCFQKWWYPQIIHFNRVFHYTSSILGYPYFWKHPYTCNCMWTSFCTMSYPIIKCQPPRIDVMSFCQLANSQWNEPNLPFP